MSNLKIIEELCGICADLAHIVTVQQNALAQYNAVVAEEEIARANARYTALLGSGEWPDDIPGQEGGEPDVY